MASLALKEADRLRMSENEYLKGIYEFKRMEVTGGFRKLYDKKLYSL
jgi:hypothetical protein